MKTRSISDILEHGDRTDTFKFMLTNWLAHHGTQASIHHLISDLDNIGFEVITNKLRQNFPDNAYYSSPTQKNGPNCSRNGSGKV